MYGNQRVYNLHLKFDFGLYIFLKTFLWADVVAMVHYPGSTRWFVFLDELLYFLTVLSPSRCINGCPRLNICGWRWLWGVREGGGNAVYPIMREGVESLLVAAWIETRMSSGAVCITLSFP